MQQTINLFDHLEKHEAIAVSSKHIVVAAIVMLAVILLVSLISVFNESRDIALLQQAEEDNERLHAQLSVLRSESTNESKSIQRSQRLLKQRREILYSLSNQQHDIGNGFSDHLTGLGRQQLKGLWLSSIYLRAGGEEISLKGSMRHATLLPRYLQDLGKEPAFSGLKFQLMKIENSEASREQMQFEISVYGISEGAESDDGGREV